MRSLNESYLSLQINYSKLYSDYKELSNSFNKLKTDYSNLQKQFADARAIMIEIILLIALIIVIVYYSRKVSKLKREVMELRLYIQQQAQQIAGQMFKNWVNQHSQQLKEQLEQAIRQQYEA